MKYEEWRSPDACKDLSTGLDLSTTKKMLEAIEHLTREAFKAGRLLNKVDAICAFHCKNCGFDDGSPELQCLVCNDTVECHGSQNIEQTMAEENLGLRERLETEECENKTQDNDFRKAVDYATERESTLKEAPMKESQPSTSGTETKSLAARKKETVTDKELRHTLECIAAWNMYDTITAEYECSFCDSQHFYVTGGECECEHDGTKLFRVLIIDRETQDVYRIAFNSLWCPAGQKEWLWCVQAQQATSLIREAKEKQKARTRSAWIALHDTFK